VGIVKEMRKARKRHAEDRTNEPQYMANNPAMKVPIAVPNAPKELKLPRGPPDSYTYAVSADGKIPTEKPAKPRATARKQGFAQSGKINEGSTKT